MATNETKFVTKDILTYYDTKLKDYIDDKLEPFQDSASISQVESLERRVDSVELKAAVNEAGIKFNKDHIDENEAAILVLQEDDKVIRKNIADIRVELENKLSSADLQDYVKRDELETDYVTQEDVQTIVKTEVSTTIEQEITTQVETIIQDKVNTGEIAVSTNSIKYGTF